MQECYDDCTNTQSCSAEWYDHEDNYKTGSCTEFYTWVDNNQPDNGGDGECTTPMECQDVSDSCLEDIQEVIPGADYCQQQYCYDSCTESEICRVIWNEAGTEHQMTCEEFAEKYQPDDNNGPEPECLECYEPDYQCKDLYMLAFCEKIDCYNTCTESYECSVNFSHTSTDET